MIFFKSHGIKKRLIKVSTLHLLENVELILAELKGIFSQVTAKSCVESLSFFHNIAHKRTFVALANLV